MSKLIVAVLVVLAFVLAPVEVTFTLVQAGVPPLPGDAEMLGQKVVAGCAAGPLLMYTYRKGDYVFMVFKAPNQAPAAMLVYKVDASGNGTLLAIYDKTDKLTQEEARARYPTLCSLIDAKA